MLSNALEAARAVVAHNLVDAVMAKVETLSNTALDGFLKALDDDAVEYRFDRDAGTVDVLVYGDVFLTGDLEDLAELEPSGATP